MIFNWSILHEEVSDHIKYELITRSVINDAVVKDSSHLSLVSGSSSCQEAWQSNIVNLREEEELKQNNLEMKNLLSYSQH